MTAFLRKNSRIWLFLRQYLTDASVSRKIEERMSTESEGQYGNH